MKGTIMQVQPYLNFNGRCDEAIEFYKKAVGAEVTMLMRFKDCPDPQEKAKIQPGVGDKVMHARLRIGDSTVFASDGRCLANTNFEGISLSLTVANEAEADQMFTALASGGNVIMPLAKTFFSKRFGMAADRFGVTWMVIVAS
jgi:PhnB protein